MGWCKKDRTPLLTHLSYVFLSLIHWINRASTRRPLFVYWKNTIMPRRLQQKIYENRFLIFVCKCNRLTEAIQTSLKWSGIIPVFSCLRRCPMFSCSLKFSTGLCFTWRIIDLMHRLPYCAACRTTLIATRFRVAVICPIIQVPHCIRVFFILFDLCLLITFFNFITNYVPIVTFWIFTYHKIWILSIMFCFIWSYWTIYFLACLEVSWRVVS